MNDIYEIRRINMRALLEARADGKQVNLARELDVPANLVSRWLSGKHIGDDIARWTEEVFGIGHGAMDQMPPTTGIPIAAPFSDTSETALSRLINNWFASDANGRVFIEQAAKLAAAAARTEGSL